MDGTCLKASSVPMRPNPEPITQEGVGYASRHTAERQKLIRRAGKLAPYTNEQLVAELRRRGAYIMYGSDFDCVTTI